ncbi:hypothetical protein BD413DRAFT_681159 [Trametes elegans]|nr:hypothetical protein BD413DRAFT_681159 [Trametes elegans]
MAASLYMRLGPYSSLPLYPLIREEKTSNGDVPSEHVGSPATATIAGSAPPAKREELRSDNKQSKQDVENIPTVKPSTNTTLSPLEVVVRQTTSNTSLNSKDLRNNPVSRVLAPTQAIQQGRSDSDSCDHGARESYVDTGSTHVSVVALESERTREKETKPEVECLSVQDSRFRGKSGGDAELTHDVEVTVVENDSQSDEVAKLLFPHQSPGDSSSRFQIWRRPGASPLVHSMRMEVNETTADTTSTCENAHLAPTTSDNAVQTVTPGPTIWLISRDNELEKVDWIPFWCKFLYARSRYWRQHPEVLEAETSTAQTTRRPKAEAPVPTPVRRVSGRGTPSVKRWRRLEAPPSPFADNSAGGVEAQRLRQVTASPSMQDAGTGIPQHDDRPEKQVCTDAASFLEKRRMEIRAIENARRRELETGEQEFAAQEEGAART